MATSFTCVRCGYSREEHEPNLVNQPVTDEFAWLEIVRTGHHMTILECMETPLPKRYLRNVEDLTWLSGCTHGYQSFDPSSEDRAVDLEKAPSHSGSGSFILIPGRRPISLE